MIPFLKKYLGHVYVAVAWSVFIGVLLTLPGSMLPKESGFAIPQFDKIVHISMFGGFVFLRDLWLSNRGILQKRLLRQFFLVFVLAAIYGIGSEFVQKYFIPMRDFDEADIIADLIGASLGYGFSNILLV
jgi:VanZ family protein